MLFLIYYFFKLALVVCLTPRRTLRPKPHSGPCRFRLPPSEATSPNYADFYCFSVWKIKLRLVQFFDLFAGILSVSSLALASLRIRSTSLSTSPTRFYASFVVCLFRGLLPNAHIPLASNQSTSLAECRAMQAEYHLTQNDLMCGCRVPWLVRLAIRDFTEVDCRSCRETSDLREEWWCLSHKRVNTPPIVSIPNDSGVTSNNKTSLHRPLKRHPEWQHQ